MMNEEATTPYRHRYKALKAEFDTNWKSHFIDLSDYLATRKGRFDRDTRRNDGSKRNENIIDGVAGRALRILAAGMQSGLTSPARPWFRLGLDDKDLEEYKPVRMFLDEVRRRMLAVFSRSNFYSAVHNVYGELGGFGTAAMLIDEDFQNVIRCFPFTIGEYFIATDGSLRVNTFYRHIDYTAVNIVNTFEEENVSQAVKMAAKENNKDKWFRVIHAIEPNYDRDLNRLDARNKPWVSKYYEEVTDDKNRFLRESGYDMFPIMAPRWSTTGSEIYGRSPGMDVLPDAMMLQKMQTDALVALDQLIKPPMNAPTSLKEKTKSIVSGGVTYVDVNQGGQGFEPTFQSNPDFKSIEYKIEKVQMAIKEGFYNDLFLMLALSGDKEMTAREVAERHEEKLLSVGPVVERLQPELLDRVIDRTYNIMDGSQMLPEAPPELEGMDIEVEYIGLLAQAQKMIGTSAIQQTAEFVGSLTEIWPEARHKFDSLQAIDEYSEMVGVPTRIIRSDDEVEEDMAAEAQQAKQAQMAENLEKTVQGAKTLSETDMDNNSALKALTSGIAS